MIVIMANFAFNFALCCNSLTAVNRHAVEVIVYFFSKKEKDTKTLTLHVQRSKLRYGRHYG